jgi:hypothetical protein
MGKQFWSSDKRGWGRHGCSDPDRIKILGDDFSKSICTDFELAEPIPIRFSLPHVCKSICKQIILLAKSLKIR